MGEKNKKILKQNANKPQPKEIEFWHMARDVLVASMNKGQFPLAMAGIIFLLMIFKMPGADVSKLVFKIFGNLENGAFLGYILSGIAIPGWFIHARVQRRVINDEMKRVSEERNTAQKLSAGPDIKSSNKL